jgi:hypothetical protein
LLLGQIGAKLTNAAIPDGGLHGTVPEVRFFVVSKSKAESIPVANSYPQAIGRAGVLLTSNNRARNLRDPIFRPILLFSDRFSTDHETHISAEPHQKKKVAWIPGQDVHSRRPPHPEATSRKRPGAALPLRRIAVAAW